MGHSMIHPAEGDPMAGELYGLREEIRKLGEAQGEVSLRLAQIQGLLAGDEYGRKPLLARVEEAEGRLSALERDRTRAWGWVLGFGVSVSWGVVEFFRGLRS